MSRDVTSIAATDCVLFLWATAPMLKDALRVMAAWGFAYKSHIVWHKLRPGAARGPGYWVTGEHELLLIGTRGNVPAPAPGTQSPSVIAAPVGEHSEKPEAFARLIESYFPNLPKVELNARRARPGWVTWGNEAPERPPLSADLAARLKALTNADGMVRVSASHCVAAEFVLEEEIPEAEAYQASLRGPVPVAAAPSINDFEIPAFLRRDVPKAGAR
jgi:N6-adenosine-specific RNA methylase IME4